MSPRAATSSKKSSSPPDVWTVSQLTRRVKSTLENTIGRVWVMGELSNFRVSPAGHSYFTLKDENSQLDGVMFKGKLSALKFEPETGLEVIIHGSITVYEPRGNYQIICDDMQPKGVGALQLAFEKLKAKLAAEGLFDEAHKKALPLLPRRIGVVTSPTGAAIRDILNVIERRFANVHVIVYPARVQGEAAAGEIVEGIRTLDEYGVDVIIAGRGGGSMEDLWAFNEEPVVRAIFAAETPIICAVGHEIDVTLSDFAADVRAPTPSAAAELVVQEHEALLEKVQGLLTRLARGLKGTLAESRNRFGLLRSSFVFQRPEELTRQRRQRVDELSMALESAVTERCERQRVRLEGAARSLALLSPRHQLSRAGERLSTQRARLLRTMPLYGERARRRLESAGARLEALSPLAILSRGYVIARRLPGHALAEGVEGIRKDDRLALQFHDGEAEVVVESTRPGRKPMNSTEEG